MPCSCNKKNYEPEIRLCCVCDSPLFGRSDKVFCNIDCKNKYHSAIRKHNKTVSNETVKILNKNYQILCFLLGKDNSKFEVNKLELQRKGFNFEILSGIKQNTGFYKPSLILKIYEFELILSQSENVIVTRNNEQSIISPYVYKRWERFYKHNENINKIE